MQQSTDPYRALGVARAATDAEIKAAHRKLAKRYHPDTGSKSDTERFLGVQDAYRVLSDPLLRKEWDQKHAPGPVRADRPTDRSSAPTPRRRRPPAPKPKAAEAADASAPPPERPVREPDPRTRPRSSRAYTWSASEVPWWEEAARGEKASGERTKPAAPAADAPNAEPQPDESKPDEPVFTQQDFDVYNRSSGAAWSMAARAYFRKGDADLPRRGSFRRQGTQVVTAGLARSAAQAEARRRAAAAATVAGAEATFAHPSPAPRTHEGTTHIVRRSLATPWPSLAQRFGYAFVAWVPLVLLFTVLLADNLDYALTSLATGVGLVCLVCLPRVAYVGAVATLLVGVVGGLFIGGVVLAGWLPSPDRLAAYVSGLLVVGYLATAAVIAFGPPSLRPWSAR